MELLLIAQSARMLAQSAVRAGFLPYAIDFFADSDTRQLTKQCVAALSDAEGFEEASLLHWVTQFAHCHDECALVFGTGVDTRPLLVEKLAQICKILGNSAVTLSLINNPRNFFPLLSQVGIPCPETRFALPNSIEGWLVKPGHGQGGMSVSLIADDPFRPKDAYFQRYVLGAVFSMLFLANGKDVQAIGFNTQWSAKHDPDQPFLFAGAINRAELNNSQRSTVEDYARKLTVETGLIGLNSLDFVVENNECLVLEINPRPSATMALYDEDFHRGLLALHIAACLGEWPILGQRASPVRAMRIVYSPRALTIPVGFHWPKGCADIPDSGKRIDAGEPLCSVLVQAESSQNAETLVKSLENNLLLSLCNH